ncbi:MAG TPA: hypothetical protein VGP56_01980 [Gaiellaceae bacterium]|jgi:hypothetical protein|nr:hypothetical protein [Gaiellaceae bacterium]
MSLVEQWKVVQSNLSDGWTTAQLRLTVEDEPERAAAMLAPAGAGRHGNVVMFAVGRGGVGSSPDLVTRLLRRLDTERIHGVLAPVKTDVPAAAAGARSRRPLLAEQWEQAQAGLPADWSDVYAELELDSSDYLEPGALLLAPLNPARVKGRLAYRFRIARRFGYGASAQMAHRCFERLDGEGMSGRFRVLRALSDTKPVYTQGPVWYVGGRAV